MEIPSTCLHWSISSRNGRRGLGGYSGDKALPTGSHSTKLPHPRPGIRPANSNQQSFNCFAISPARRRANGFRLWVATSQEVANLRANATNMVMGPHRLPRQEPFQKLYSASTPGRPLDRTDHLELRHRIRGRQDQGTQRQPNHSLLRIAGSIKPLQAVLVSRGQSSR